MAKARISIVTPVYNEGPGLDEYLRATCRTFVDDDETSFEFVLVDDGSVDDSWARAAAAARSDPRLRALRLSRNFGPHTALTAGITSARGDAVATLAADLQDPPETVLEFIARWRAGAQVVWGKRRTRDDSRWRVLAGELFFTLIRRHAMPRGSRFTTGSFLLIDRKVVECFRQFPERNRITFALVAWTGFDQDVVEYDRRRREVGASKWSFSRLLRAMYDTFIGFSDAPARVMTVLGVATSLLTVPAALYLIIDWMTTDTLPGWTGIMVAMTVFFGLQFLMMGLVGEYLHRIYGEATRRPLYFVSQEAGDSPWEEARG